MLYLAETTNAAAIVRIIADADIVEWRDSFVFRTKHNEYRMISHHATYGEAIDARGELRFVRHFED